MEDTHWAAEEGQGDYGRGLNPCFNGRYSLSEVWQDKKPKPTS